MKFFTLVVAAVALFAQSLAQPFIGRPFLGGPFLGGGLMGGGLLGGGLLGGGLLGNPFLNPFLGVGLGSFGPLAGFGTGIARFGGIRGRRSVEGTEHIECLLSSDTISCTGSNHIIQCHVETNTKVDVETSPKTKFILKEKVVNGHPILKIVPKKIIDRLGHKFERISVFSSDSLAKSELGFRVIDPVCFDVIRELVKELPEHVKVEIKETI